ncbi:retinol dehydrogenase [Branchiostoma belcheri]|nr:retinol dehydrogenase [Branchiostoma belcheri]
MARFATRLGPYCTSKFAIEGFSDSLRRSLSKSFGVSVHLIEPGGYKTQLVDPDRARAEFTNAWQRLPAELQEEYGEEYRDQVMEKVIDSFGQHVSSKIYEVIDAMEHALCAANPRSRYVVGFDAMLLLIPLSWLPTSLADAIFCNAQKPPVDVRHLLPFTRGGWYKRDPEIELSENQTSGRQRDNQIVYTSLQASTTVHCEKGMATTRIFTIGLLACIAFVGALRCASAAAIPDDATSGTNALLQLRQALHLIGQQLDRMATAQVNSEVQAEGYEDGHEGRTVTEDPYVIFRPGWGK